MSYNIISDSRSESPINAEKNEWQVWGPSAGSGTPQTEYPTLMPVHDLSGHMPEPGPVPFVHEVPSQMIENGWNEISTFTAPPSGANEVAAGWFPPPPGSERHAYPDANATPAMSPTGRAPYHVAYLHSYLPFGHDGHQVLPVDARPFHPAMPPPPHFQPVPFSPPFSQFPINLNTPPEFGSYHLAPPPEPFVDFSFTFSNGFNAPTLGNAHYPTPLRPYPLLPNPMLSKPYPNHQIPPHIQSPINLDSYPHHPNHTASGPHPFISIPEIVHQLLPPPHELAIYGPSLAPTPQSYTSPPHVLVSPPIAHIQSNLATGSGGSVPFTDGCSSQKSQDTAQINIQSIPRSLLCSTPSTAIIISSSKAKRPSPPPHVFTPSVQRGHRKFRRPYLLTDCSTLMSDFRKNPEKIWEFAEILGHVAEFSNDQHGSRFIQLKLETITDEEKQVAFDEIHPEHTEELIQNVFGNYVIQKFLDYGTTAQKDAITEVVERRAQDFSLHIYGCRVVQKAIDRIPECRQRTVIKLLEQDILTCIKDPHGNHVIQKIIQVVTPGMLTFLPSIGENILNLATHSYGCRVLQRCLEYVSPDYLEDLLEAIHRSTFELMQDQYGNYVIQFIIQHGQAKDKNIVISKINNNLIGLSHHKYASNVCEKALVHTDSEGRHKLIHEIMVAPTDAENPIVKMIKDQYANYVLQRSLLLVEGEQREALYAQVKPLVIALRESTTHNTRRLGPLLSIERLVNDFYQTQQPELADENST